MGYNVAVKVEAIIVDEDGAPLAVRPQSEAYLKLLSDMGVMHLQKAMGYSGQSQDVWANFRASEWLGMTGFQTAMSRWQDKVSRIQNLVANSQNDVLPEETLEDTLMDAASYALIALSILREEYGKMAPRTLGSSPKAPRQVRGEKQ